MVGASRLILHHRWFAGSASALLSYHHHRPGTATSSGCIESVLSGTAGPHPVQRLHSEDDDMRTTTDNNKRDAMSTTEDNRN
jgi:hypothetical protein